MRTAPRHDTGSPRGLPDTLYDDAGLVHSVSGGGTAGGEGTVLPLRGSSSVAKVYHAGRLTPERVAKLSAMVCNPPRDPTWETSGHRSIAWPQRLLFSDPARRQVCGFLMPSVDTSRFSQAHVYYDPQDRGRRFGGGFTWAHLLTAAHNLCSAVASVHAGGHRVGDLRETNVLVAPTALVTLIDCDSFQVRDAPSGRVFPTRVGSGEYLPPELQGIDFGTTQPDRTAADLFALAVLVFRFLMNGAHPFQARGPRVQDAPSTEAKIALGLFPYEGRRRGLEPPAYAPPYAAIPKSLRAMFARAFVDGHGQASARPDAQEWVAALSSVARRVRSCARNEHHRYAGRSCPWCAMRASGTGDPFPTPLALGAQVHAAEPATPPDRSDRLELVRSHAQVAVADDSLSDSRLAALHALGDRLGLRRADVDRVVDETIRARARQRAPSPPRPAAQPADGLAGGGAERPPLVRRVAAWAARARALAAQNWKWLAPVWATIALAGAAAPLGVAAALVAVVLPALAASSAEGQGPRRAASIAIRFARAVPVAVAHGVTVAAPVAATVAVLYLALVRIVPGVAAARICGGAAACTLTWLVAVKTPSQDAVRFAGWAAHGRGALAGALAGPSGRLTTAGRMLWVVALAAAAVNVVLPPAWWPLSGPPL